MRVTRRTFEKLINKSISILLPGHSGSTGDAIGINIKDEKSSKRIQEALFKMGYWWSRGRNKHEFKPNLTSLYVRPTPLNLMPEKILSVEEMQIKMRAEREYIILPVTDVGNRLSNFEDDKEV